MNHRPSNTLPSANKKLGQHFLVDTKIISSICQDLNQHAQFLVEVGPGPAILTQHLARQKEDYVVVEMDRRFEQQLMQHLKPQQICWADALHFDLPQLLTEKGWDNQKGQLISNLPYNISVPLFIKFLQCPQFHWMTLMFQREVAQKIYNKSATKNEMGSLMALAQNYFEVQQLVAVAPGAFSPPPQVDSTVLSFQRRIQPVISLQAFASFELFLRRLFQFKRKQCQKILKSYYPAEKWPQALAQCQIDPKDRAESFTLEKIQLLYLHLHS